jgi:hypothetical protein
VLIGFRSREFGLDSELKRVSKCPDFMRGTLSGTGRRFWAGLLVYVFTLVFGFLIDHPNCDLSTHENTFDFQTLDDPDDLGGLHAFVSKMEWSLGLAFCRGTYLDAFGHTWARLLPSALVPLFFSWD